MRPIDHLLDTPVLVEGYINTWQPTADGDAFGLLLTRVRLRDYETGKQAIAPDLDHCWLWIPEKLWKTRYECALRTGEQSLIHDRAWMCCHVEKYIRSNGTMDYGLCPRNEFPISPEQAHVIRQSTRKLARKMRSLSNEELMRNWCSQAIYMMQLNHCAADWRELSYSFKSARATIKRNWSALAKELEEREFKGQIDPAMLENYFNSWRVWCSQTAERLGIEPLQQET